VIGFADALSPKVQATVWDSEKSSYGLRAALFRRRGSPGKSYLVIGQLPQDVETDSTYEVSRD